MLMGDSSARALSRRYSRRHPGARCRVVVGDSPWPSVSGGSSVHPDRAVGREERGDVAA